MKEKDPLIRKQAPERSWLETCCFGCSCLQHFWPKLVLRKWLNITHADSDFSADAEDGDTDFESENEECDGCAPPSRFGNDNREEDYDDLPSKTSHRARRRNSETFRAQYINTKELRISVGTWNVGGKLPPDDLDISDWLDVDEPADIYVLGFQEIVPLNAGNILGAEDSRPVPKWEYIIRDTLNRVRPPKPKFKCYSDPPSPSKFKSLDDIPDVEDELINTDSDCDEEVTPLNETDSDGAEEVHPFDGHFDLVKDCPVESENETITTSNASNHADIHTSKEQGLQRQSSFLKKFDTSCQVEGCMEKSEPSVIQPKRKLTKTLSGTERLSMSWPEPPLDFLSQRDLERPNSFKSVKSFRVSKSFRTSNSFKSSTNPDSEATSEIALLAELDLESIINRKRRSPFVRVVSKQMVGVFLSIWVRRSLRRHIQNVKVSTVGVGIMGYIGNKGAVSVSMSIYQTRFCFICTHLTSGEKFGDELRRNADVKEIHRRTQFHATSNNDFPKTILNHERIIWFGDLTYRINLPYEKIRELISRKEWSTLAENDQLIRELKKGRAFDGWKEGALNFPPTYKYELNSDIYCGEDPKSGRRNPAWCDRILAFGDAMRLLSYKRVENMLSDHRPVKAVFMAEVEVFCHNRLRKALAFTVAELDDENIANLESYAIMSLSRFGKDTVSDKPR